MNASLPTPTGYRYALELATGKRYVRVTRKPLRNWKSALMALAPYDTDYKGATYKRTTLA